MSIFNSESPLNPRNNDLWCLVHMQDCEEKWQSKHETVKQYFWEVHSEILAWEQIPEFLPHRRKVIETP